MHNLSHSKPEPLRIASHATRLAIRQDSVIQRLKSGLGPTVRREMRAFIETHSRRWNIGSFLNFCIADVSQEIASVHEFHRKEPIRSYRKKFVEVDDVRMRKIR